MTLLDNCLPSTDDMETEEKRNSMLISQQESLIKLFAVSTVVVWWGGYVELDIVPLHPT